MNGWIGRLLRLGRGDERGAVLPLTAVGLVAALAATSLTIDIGRIANRRRDLQAVADLVAIDASRVLAGRPLGAIVADEAIFLDQVEASAKANRFLQKGAARTSGTADAADRFVPRDPAADGEAPNAWSLESADSAQRLLVVLGTSGSGGGFTPVQVTPPVLPEDASAQDVAAAQQAAADAANATVVDAVRVVAIDRIEHQFSPGANTTSRSGVASAVAAGGLGIRSGLATIDGSLLDRMLGQLLGVELTAVDYTSLAGASVSFRDLATHLDVGSLDELLELDLPATRLFDAYAVLLRRDPATLAAAQLMENVAGSVGTPSVELARLVSVTSGGEAAALTAGLDALSLLTGVGYLIGKDRVVSLDVATTVPGAASVPVDLSVVEPPQWAFGPTGTVVRTAQVRALARPSISWSSANYTGDKCQLLEQGHVTGLADCLVDSLLGTVGGLQVIDVPNLVRIDVGGSYELDLGAAQGSARIGNVVCAAEGVAPVMTIDEISASAATAVLGGALGVRAVLLPGDPEHERTVSLGGSSIVGEQTVQARQVPPIRFDDVVDDGDPDTEELPDFGSWVGTGGFGVDVASSGLTIPWSPDPDPVLDVLTQADGRVGTLATRAFERVVADRVEPLAGKLLTRLEAELGVGLANVEVLAVPPSCAGMRLVG